MLNCPDIHKEWLRCLNTAKQSKNPTEKYEVCKYIIDNWKTCMGRADNFKLINWKFPKL